MSVYHMGTKQAFIVFGGGIMAASVLTSVLFRAGGSTPRTHNKEWAAATKELLKFQDMNPIGIGGRRSFDPKYFDKE